MNKIQVKIYREIQLRAENRKLYIIKGKQFYNTLAAFPPYLQPNRKLSSIYKIAYEAKSGWLVIANKGATVVAQTDNSRYYAIRHIGLALIHPKHGVECVDIGINGNLKTAAKIVLRPESACSPSFLMNSQRCNCYDQWRLTQKLIAAAQKVTIFQGNKAVVMARKYIIDSIDDGGTYYILNANIAEFLKAMGGEFERQERELARRKIKQEFLAYAQMKEELSIFGKRYFKSVAREYYFIDEATTIPMSVDFSDRRVAILVFGLEPLVIGIADKILAAGYKEIFESLKKLALK